MLENIGAFRLARKLNASQVSCRGAPPFLDINENELPKLLAKLHQLQGFQSHSIPRTRGDMLGPTTTFVQSGTIRSFTPTGPMPGMSVAAVDPPGTEALSRSSSKSSVEKFDDKASRVSDSDGPVELLDVEKAAEEPTLPEEPYSEWTPWERRFIILCASTAAFFSPLSANIYFPLFETLANVFDVSITDINLTVTTYMIFQGITPMFVAAFSDGLGRRPAYVMCFIIYLAANIGLALQTQYTALAILRCLQSAGSASTVALAKAVVADIATSEQRGRYSSLTSVGMFLGPALGPVIGGLLAYYLGWRSVFWLLVISAGVFLLILLIAFPETCRKVVGNGSRRPAKWNTSLVTIMHFHRKGRALSDTQGSDDAPKPKFKMPNFWLTITLTLEKEMLVVTITSGMVFSAFYAVTSSVPSLFAEIYGYNSIQIGLCFIAVGAGSFVAALMQGYLIDWNYRRHATLTGFPLVKNKNQDLSDFPLETARLELAIPLVALLGVSTISFGWLVHFETSVAGPLVMLFLCGFSSTAAYSVITVLIIDVHPDKPASATAGNNLVRCLMSAGATAAIIPMVNALGRGWAFTLVALICIAFLPLLALCMKRGHRWRAELKRGKSGG